jgi:hypothetical protein
MSIRRRPWTDQSPLELEMTRMDYSTFHQRSHGVSYDQLPLWYTTLAVLVQGVTTLLSGKWAMRFAAVIAAVLFMCSLLQLDGKLVIASSGTRQETWNWDLYHYSPKVTGKKDASQQNTLLVVQLATKYNKPWIQQTCRPNQAYAKQWDADFLQIIGRRHYPKAAHVMQAIHDKQQREALEPNHSDASRTVYSYILILPPDAIITNIDVDIRTLMQPNAIVAMTEEGTGVMMWNMDHEAFATTLTMWVELISIKQDDDNYSNIPTEVPDVLQVLPVSDVGFVEPKMIKLQMDKNRSPANVVTQILQTTADSVCYRYYPRCEVL